MGLSGILPPMPTLSFGQCLPATSKPELLIPTDEARRAGWPPIAAVTAEALRACFLDAERWHELRSQDDAVSRAHA